MFIKLTDGFAHFSEATSKLSELQTKILTSSNTFRDQEFGFESNFEICPYELARRLFSEGFLIAFQLAADEYRQISQFDWQEDSSAYSILNEGFFASSPLSSTGDDQRYEIYIHASSISQPELECLQKLVLAHSRSLGDEHSIFQNAGDIAAGEFEPTDAGVTAEAIRLCDAFDLFAKERFRNFPQRDAWRSDLTLLVNDAKARSQVADEAFDHEELRRKFVAAAEFRVSLSMGELPVKVRARNSLDPVLLPRAYWWVTNEYEDIFGNHVIHVDKDDRFSAFNGAVPFLSKPNFESWFEKTFSKVSSHQETGKRGRPPGATTYLSDDACVDEIKAILASGRAPSFAAAFRMLGKKVEIKSSEEASERRLRRKFNKKYKGKK